MVAAIVDDVIDEDSNLVTVDCATFGTGCDKCRTTKLSRLNMRLTGKYPNVERQWVTV